VSVSDEFAGQSQATATAADEQDTHPRESTTPHLAKQKIVYTSIVNPSDSNPITVAEEHRGTEELIRASDSRGRRHSTRRGWIAARQSSQR